MGNSGHFVDICRSGMSGAVVLFGGVIEHVGLRAEYLDNREVLHAHDLRLCLRLQNARIIKSARPVFRSALNCRKQNVKRKKVGQNLSAQTLTKEPRWPNGYRVRLISGRSRIRSRATSD
jgi:uncharacterized protein YwbE